VDHDIKNLREEMEKFGIKWGRVEEVFEDGLGSCRAVESMMMTILNHT
jgi:hypothetical protein